MASASASILRRASGALVLLLVAAPARGGWPTDGLRVGTPETNEVERVWPMVDGPDSLFLGLRNRGGSHPFGGDVVRVTASGERVWGIEGATTGYRDAAWANGSSGVAFGALGGPDVFLQRVSLAGNWMVPAASTSAIEEYPAVVDDGAGGAVVAYRRDLFEVVLQRFYPNGAVASGWPWSGRRVALSGTEIQRFGPALVADGGGGAFVAWAAAGDRARAQHVTASSAIDPAWPAAGRVLGTGFPALEEPRLVHLQPSGTDHLLAAWLERVPLGGSVVETRLVAQRVRRDGTLDPAWPPGGRIAIATQDTVLRALALPQPDGGVTFAWSEGVPPAVHALRLLATGTVAPGWPKAVSPPLASAAATPPWDHPFAAASDDSGGVFVAWDEVGPSGRTVRVTRVLAAGEPHPLWPASGLAAHDATVEGSARAAIADGVAGVYVAWRDPEADPPGSSFHDLRLNRVVPPALVSVPRANAGRAPALVSIAPNPARERLDVRLTLAGEAPARLELLDVSGRRLRAVGLRGAGERSARIDGLGALPPGLYLVRLEQGGASRVARVAIVR
jgi:hypothetical protein